VDRARLSKIVARAVARRPRAIAQRPAVGRSRWLAIPLAVRRFNLSNVETDFAKLRRRDTWTSGERYWGAKMDRMLGRNLAPTVLLTDTPDRGARARPAHAGRRRRRRSTG
jgi:hypothetical protein